MTPIKSSTLNASSDLLKQNQTTIGAPTKYDFVGWSNGVYPVRPNPVILHLTSLPWLTIEPRCLLQDAYQLMVVSWSLTGCRGAEV